MTDKLTATSYYESEAFLNPSTDEQKLFKDVYEYVTPYLNDKTSMGVLITVISRVIDPAKLQTIVDAKTANND